MLHLNKPVMLLPRHMAERKPPHGSPCTRCGICCMASLCPLAKTIFGDRPGPCPALTFDKNGSVCGVVERSPEGSERRKAAKLLINSGAGCDARINGEPVNHAYNNALAKRDAEIAAEIAEARRIWGIE